MDTSNNREELHTHEGTSSHNVQARVVSFLREDQPWRIEKIQEYFRTAEGKRSGLVGLGVLFVIVVLWILASMSLPGQLLYGLKVHVFEEAGGLVRWSTESKAAYNLDLMKERFREVQKLSGEASITEGALAALSNRITENTDAFVSLTQGSEERTLDRRKVIDFTNEFVGVTAAIEEVAEGTEPLLPLSDTIGDARRDAQSRLRDEIEVYVSLTNDDDLRNFLTNELQEISDRIAEGDLTQDTTDAVSRSLGDVAAAIAANDTDAAVFGIFEAHRHIVIEKYLETGR